MRRTADEQAKAFVNAKCDRCGKVTRRVFNGEHELYVLPVEWGDPFNGHGDFCEPCIFGHSQEDWFNWLKEHGRLSPADVDYRPEQYKE